MNNETTMQELNNNTENLVVQLTSAAIYNVESRVGLVRDKIAETVKLQEFPDNLILNTILSLYAEYNAQDILEDDLKERIENKWIVPKQLKKEAEEATKKRKALYKELRDYERKFFSEDPFYDEVWDNSMSSNNKERTESFAKRRTNIINRFHYNNLIANLAGFETTGFKAETMRKFYNTRLLPTVGDLEQELITTYVPQLVANETKYAEIVAPKKKRAFWAF